MRIRFGGNGQIFGIIYVTYNLHLHKEGGENGNFG
jgi:hypothetical protein